MKKLLAVSLLLAAATAVQAESRVLNITESDTEAVTTYTAVTHDLGSGFKLVASHEVVFTEISNTTEAELEFNKDYKFDRFTVTPSVGLDFLEDRGKDLSAGVKANYSIPVDAVGLTVDAYVDVSKAYNYSEEWIFGVKTIYRY